MRKQKAFGVRLLLSILALICFLNTAALALSGAADEIIDAMDAGYDECALGDLTADAVRYATGADMALVGGGLLRMNLPYGELTADALTAVYADNADIRIYTVDAATLYRLFEISVARECQLESGDLDPENSAFDGFLQISGLKLVWDASGPAGDRVYSLEDATGCVLDREDRTYCARVAVTSDLLAAEYGYAELLGESEAGQIDLFSCLTDYAAAEGPLRAPETDRIYVRAANRNQLIKDPLFALLAIAVLFLGSAFAKRIKTGHSNKW